MANVSQTIRLIGGLSTHPNQFSESPQGSLSVAQNVVIDRESVIESRRGQTQYGNQLKDPVDGSVATPNQLFVYDNTLLLRGSGTTTQNFLSYDAGDGYWVPYGSTSYNNPSSNNRMKSLESNQNIYFTTAAGVYKLDSISSDTPILAGAPQALDGYTTLVDDGYGFLQSATSCAYRIVWGYTDLNNNLILGAPSQQCIATNDAYHINITAFNGKTVKLGSGVLGVNVQAKDTVTQGTTTDTIATVDGYVSPYASVEMTNVDNWTVGSPVVLSRSVSITGNNNVDSLYVLHNQTNSEATPLNYTITQGSTTLPLTTWSYNASTDITTMKVGDGYSLYSSGSATLTNNNLSVATFSGNTITVDNPNPAIIAVSTIYQGGNQASVLNISGNNITLNGVLPWVVGPAYVQYTADVKLQFLIPQGITTKWFYQIYRSDSSAQWTPGQTQYLPDDECKLVYEANPSSTDISNGYIVFTDKTPNSLLSGTSLYTNQSQEGISQSNYQPPFALDMDLYLGYVFYGNTKQPTNYTITLIADGYYVKPDGSAGWSTNGLNVGDTITIGGVVYTAGTTTNYATNTFGLGTSVSPSLNIQTSAVNLVSCINRSSANTQYYAYYQSTSTSLPGQIYLVGRNVNTSNFSLISSRGSAWNPVLPSSGTTQSSVAETTIARVYYSKLYQPEAVPIVNYLDVGSLNQPIRRVIASRESVFVLKDDGIFRITGQDPDSFTVTTLDSTISVKHPQSAVNFNNQVYCYSNQGVIAISETGVEILSRPIESDIYALSAYANFDANTFGVSYEADHKYMLWTISTPDDTSATQAYVYNSITRSWTTYNMPRNSGLVNKTSNSLLYMTTPDDGYVRAERKNFNLTDYADEQYPVNIVSWNLNTVTLNSTVGLIVGYSLSQNSISSVITSINSTTQITVADALNWNTGAAEVLTPISCSISFNPLYCDSLYLTKQFSQISYLFRDAAFDTLQVNYSTDLTQVMSSQNITPVISSSPWGEFPWGLAPWGGANGGQQMIRTLPPRNSYGRFINISAYLEKALQSFSLEGVILEYNPVSNKTR